jgi:hypothetical protein
MVSRCHRSMCNGACAQRFLTTFGIYSLLREVKPLIVFLRTILYPKLEDNELVKDYPDVKGMSKNVMFFTHNHKEDGGQESVSKVNSFEVSTPFPLSDLKSNLRR